MFIQNQNIENWIITDESKLIDNYTMLLRQRILTKLLGS
jgi:hypothetical protein